LDHLINRIKYKIGSCVFHVYQIGPWVFKSNKISLCSFYRCKINHFCLFLLTNYFFLVQFLVISEEWRCKGNEDRLGMKETPRFHDGISVILFLVMWQGWRSEANELNGELIWQYLIIPEQWLYGDGTSGLMWLDNFFFFFYTCQMAHYQKVDKMVDFTRSENTWTNFITFENPKTDLIHTKSTRTTFMFNPN
jgi:hypothetical protein